MSEENKTGVNKAWSEAELTKNSNTKKPISIPVTFGQPTIPQSDLTEELQTNQNKLIANLEAQIKNLNETVEILKKYIAALEKQLGGL